MDLKRKRSDEGLSSVHKHTCRTTEVEGSKQKGMPKSNSPSHVYGCPGDGGRCLERKNRYWRSQKEFREHFETHVEDYRTTNGYRCPACKDSKSSPGVTPILSTTFDQDRDLARHIYLTHLKSATPKEPRYTALEMDYGTSQSSVSRDVHTKEIVLEHLLVNSATTAQCDDQHQGYPRT
jgi:hypothetical protein